MYFFSATWAVVALLDVVASLMVVLFVRLTSLSVYVCAAGGRAADGHAVAAAHK